jgi:hypothetical protein
MLSGRAPRGESILPIKSHARVGLSALAEKLTIREGPFRAQTMPPSLTQQF